MLDRQKNPKYVRAQHVFKIRQRCLLNRQKCAFLAGVREQDIQPTKGLHGACHSRRVLLFVMRVNDASGHPIRWP